MLDYTRSLGNAVKRARKQKGFTQREVANLADVDVRTVLNIENYKGNPKIEVLFPLIRVLEIDPVEIFYPEMQNTGDAQRALQMFLAGCSQKELEALLPICKSVCSVMRTDSISLTNPKNSGE